MNTQEGNGLLEGNRDIWSVETEPRFRVVELDTLFPIPPGEFLVSSFSDFYDVAPTTSGS